MFAAIADERVYLIVILGLTFLFVLIMVLFILVKNGGYIDNLTTEEQEIMKLITPFSLYISEPKFGVTHTFCTTRVSEIVILDQLNYVKQHPHLIAFRSLQIVQRRALWLTLLPLLGMCVLTFPHFSFGIVLNSFRIPFTQIKSELFLLCLLPLFTASMSALSANSYTRKPPIKFGVFRFVVILSVLSLGIVSFFAYLIYISNGEQSAYILLCLLLIAIHLLVICYTNLVLMVILRMLEKGEILHMYPERPLEKNDENENVDTIVESIVDPSTIDE